MTYSIEISELADKKFSRLAKRNKKTLEIINKKLSEIVQNPEHFKPLMGEMHGARRVHIDTSFVLTFEVIEEKKLIRILDYDHHDKIYS